MDTGTHGIGLAAHRAKIVGPGRGFSEWRMTLNQVPLIYMIVSVQKNSVHITTFQNKLSLYITRSKALDQDFSALLTPGAQPFFVWGLSCAL